MQIVYSSEKLPKVVTKSIFLAGPTQRISAGERYDLSWRDTALKLLASLDYDGVVYVPLFREAVNEGLRENSDDDYNLVTEWEEQAMARSDVIVFWVDRNDEQIGLTTNVEFGMQLESRRMWYGRPDDATHVRYLDHHAEKRGMPIFDNLDKLLRSALVYLGDGEKRSGGAELVPLVVYRTHQFKEWFANHTNQGNRLESFKIKSIIHFRNKHNPEGHTFGYSAFVALYIKEEDRIKNDEWVFNRTPVSYVVCYHPDQEYGTELSYVLVRDFRSPVNNNYGYVFEHPGGSAGDGDDPKYVAAKELKEEIGLEISEDRLNALTHIQTFATMLSNKVNLYSVELTDEEWTEVNRLADTHTVLGENEFERITLVIVPESKLGAYPIDLCTYGAVHINKHFLSLNNSPDAFEEGC